MSAAATRSASSSGSLTGCGVRCRQRPATAGSAMTSAGSSRCVAPGFSAVATAKALRTASATVRGSCTRAFHLVIGCIISTVSMNWWVSLCMPDRSTWPVIATSGRVVQVGVGDAGRQVGRARTEGGQADAGLAGEAPVGLGHEGGALLVAGGHEGDLRGAVERLVEVERLLAGDAEDVLDALVLEAGDELVGGDQRDARARPATPPAVPRPWPENASSPSSCPVPSSRVLERVLPCTRRSRSPAAGRRSASGGATAFSAGSAA